jgi:hypothetical protein
MLLTPLPGAMVGRNPAFDLGAFCFGLLDFVLWICLGFRASIFGFAYPYDGRPFEIAAPTTGYYPEISRIRQFPLDGRGILNPRRMLDGS